MKRKRPSAEQDRRDRLNQRKKRAPAGPAKRAAKKLPERRAMIAARRRRIGPRLREAREAAGAMEPQRRPGRQPRRSSGPIRRCVRGAPRRARRGAARAARLGRPAAAAGGGALLPRPRRSASAGCAGGAALAVAGRDRGQRGAHARGGRSASSIAAAGVCLRRLPVPRLPRGRDRPAGLRRPARASPGRRPSTSGPPATPTPTCWSRSAWSAIVLGGLGLRAPRAPPPRARRGRAWDWSRSP